MKKLNDVLMLGCLVACTSSCAFEMGYEEAEEVAEISQELKARCPDVFYARLDAPGWQGDQTPVRLATTKLSRTCIYKVPPLTVSKPLPVALDCRPPAFGGSYMTCVRRENGVVTHSERITCPNPVNPGRPFWYVDNVGGPARPVTESMQFDLSRSAFPPVTPIFATITSGYRITCAYPVGKELYLVYLRTVNRVI